MIKRGNVSFRSDERSWSTQDELITINALYANFTPQ